MDFYDPDIEEKLRDLELEEEKILKIEMGESALMEGQEEEDDNSDGVTEVDLKKSLKEVRGKKILLKMKHKLKKNLRARSKNKNLADMEAHLESKGIKVNKESLKMRVKKRRSILELEGNQDKKALKFEDSDGEDGVVQEGRGRKRQRSVSSDMDID